MKRYGKSVLEPMRIMENRSGDLSFCRETSAIDPAYIMGPCRVLCANCRAELPTTPDLDRRTVDSLAVGYVFCRRCTHLNGVYEADTAFLHAAYSPIADLALYNSNFYEDGTKDEFDHRVRSIYLPKAEFLAESLRSIGQNPEEHSVLDIGAGAGHFVDSLERAGFTASGIEPMASSVRAAHALTRACVEEVPTSRTLEVVENTECSIVSMICLLPHLNSVDGILGAIKSNSNIKYVFQLVPILSTSALLSLAAPEYMARVISGTHTHLHTRRSLSHLEAIWSLERVAEWWFGTDSISLRTLVVSLLTRSGLESNPDLLDQLILELAPADLDGIQLALDHREQSDQVHLLWST